jgi:hypothetical protein
MAVSPIPPVKLAQVISDWKFTTGNQLPPEAWEMLRCIAAPDQEGFKLAVVKVLIEVANEHMSTRGFGASYEQAPRRQTKHAM